jgi:alpha-galactosidase
MESRIGLLLLVLVVEATNALNNGVGRTPPMGFNTWTAFGCNPSETLMIAQGDKLIQTGMAVGPALPPAALVLR